MSDNTGSSDRAADVVKSPSLADVQAAAARIAPHAHRTPVMRCSAIDEMLGASLHSSVRTSKRSVLSSSVEHAIHCFL